MRPAGPDGGFLRAEGQHPDVFPGSPDAILGVFLAVLQARFYDTYDPLPWMWSPDPTPDTDDNGSPDTPRRIYIEREGASYPDARNVRPALLVGRGVIQYSRIGAGHRAVHDYPRGGEMLVCHANTVVRVACLSREDGESAVLADTVASFFLASAPEIRAAFQIIGIEPPQIGETSLRRFGQNDIEFHETQVGIPIEFNHKWYRWPLAPVLREARLHLDTNGVITSLRDVLQIRTP